MRKIAIVGKSGTGKTYSLRFLPPKKTFFITPNNKILPFKDSKKNYQLFDKEKNTGNRVITDKLKHIQPMIKYIKENRPEIKYIVVEDFTHFFNAITRSSSFRSKETGNETWARWRDFGYSVFEAIMGDEGQFDNSDITIIHIYHCELEGNELSGSYKIKTPGKLLENEIDLPSYYNYVIYSLLINDGNETKYSFVLNRNSMYPAKTLPDIFEDDIVDNDILFIINKIKEFEGEEIETNDKEKKG